jgi:hypothetical protein
MEEEEEIIFSYTTKEAVADGTLIKVEPDAYRSAGIKFPVYVTCAVWNRYIVFPDNIPMQFSQNQRIRAFLNMFAQQARTFSGSTFIFKILVEMPDEFELEKNEEILSKRTRIISFKGTITAQDIDDPTPAIFIMLPWED